MRRHARSYARGSSILIVAGAVLVGAPATAGSGDPLLTPERVAALKFAIAAGAAGLLLWGILLRRAGRMDAFARLRDALLLALGILGAFGWWNFFQLRYGPGYGHPLDVYHYYLGSKYFEELGYTRLYICTTVADAESGFRERAARRLIRNLETYERESGLKSLRDPARCKRHFSPERWKAFKHDVGWFRERIPEGLWQGALADHGYNPSPAWTALGAAFVRAGPVTEEEIFPLLLLDPLLLIAMWALAWKAFGWRATCVALVFWGTNLPADYLWTGGAFLRQVWLFALTVGICCLRIGWMATAGALLTVSAALRVFPMMAIFGVALAAGIAMWRARSFRLSAAHRRFALGCAAAAVVVTSLSFATGGGPRAWADFARNIRFHAGTPFVTNVGLRSFLAYDADTSVEAIERDPASTPSAWWDARKATFERRRMLFVGILVGYLALLAAAVARSEDWEAAALGSGAVVMAVAMSSYYYGVLLGFGFLWTRRESIGAALCGLSAVTWWIEWTWPQDDEVYAWVSLATVIFVVAATALMARRRAPDGAPAADSSDAGAPAPV